MHAYVSVILCRTHDASKTTVVPSLALQANPLLLGAMTTCAEMIPAVWDAPNFTQTFLTRGKQPRNWHVYHTEQMND